MKCPVCNAEASAPGRFCRSCGATLPAGGGAAQEASVCPACGRAVQPGAKFCAACAAPLSGGATPPAAAASSTCANCGAALVAGAKFCKACGRGVASSAPTPDMMPTAVMGTPVQPGSAPPRRPPQAPAMSAPVRPAPASPPAAARPVAARPSGGNRPILLAGVVVLALVAVGLTYRFVLRKPAAQSAPTAEAPGVAQPTTPAPGETIPESANPESQTAATNETQQPADAGPAAATPAGNSEATGGAAPASSRSPKRAPAKPSGSGYAQAHNNAVQALAASQFLDPAEGSALFWARKAKALGDPTAAQIEQQAFAGQMAEVQSARQNHNYDQARAMLYVLIHYFPDRPELQPMQGDIQQEEQSYTQQLEQQRRQAEQQAQTKKFAVQHRHGTGSSFCTGIITVAPDGSARYDCSTADSQGRCEHVAFTPGSLKEVKVRGDGSLHVATRQSGNFDFSGSDSAIKDAATALGPLVKH